MTARIRAEAVEAGLYSEEDAAEQLALAVERRERAERTRQEQVERISSGVARSRFGGQPAPQQQPPATTTPSAPPQPQQPSPPPFMPPTQPAPPAPQPPAPAPPQGGPPQQTDDTNPPNQDGSRLSVYIRQNSWMRVLFAFIIAIVVFVIVAPLWGWLAEQAAGEGGWADHGLLALIIVGGATLFAGVAFYQWLGGVVDDTTTTVVNTPPDQPQQPTPPAPAQQQVRWHTDPDTGQQYYIRPGDTEWTAYQPTPPAPATQQTS